MRDIIDALCINFRLPDYVWFDALSSSPLFEEDRRGMNCHAEQQIILEAFGYITSSKLSQLGKIMLLFFSLSKDTPKMKINWVKLIKQKERAQKSLI